MTLFHKYLFIVLASALFASPFHSFAMEPGDEPAGQPRRPAFSFACLNKGVPDYFLSYLSIDDLKVFRLVERTTRAQVDDFADRAATVLASSWSKNLNSFLSSDKEQYLFELATRVHRLDPGGDQPHSAMRRLLDKKGYLVLPKGELCDTLRIDLTRFQGGKPKAPLLSMLVNEEVRETLLPQFHHLAHDRRLQRAALQHALASYKVIGAVDPEDIPSMALKILAGLPETYTDFKTAKQNADNSPTSQIVITLEELKDPENVHDLNKVFYFYPLPTLIVDVDQDPLENFGYYIEDIDSILPVFLTHIALTNVAQNLQSIGPYFLSKWNSLVTCDISGLTTLQNIGRGFLSGCESLTTFDTSGLTALQFIDHHFLHDCKSLATFDTAGLTALQSIDDDFLADCTHLVTIDTSGLIALQSIAGGFLYGCKSLVTFDTSSLKNLSSIGWHFLSRCVSIKHFSTSGFTALRSIDSYFLYRCKSLITVDFSGLIALQSIRSDFLDVCKSLKTIDVSNLRSLKDTPDHKKILKELKRLGFTQLPQ